MNHKCRVYKTHDIDYPWATQCYNRECSWHRGYYESNNWEEAMVAAFMHRFTNR